MLNNSFRTEILKLKTEQTITHKDPILLVGSCFAESIAEKLARYKFTINNNPFGILYNSASIAQSLDLLTESSLFQEDDLFFTREEWISFLHHGRFSNSDKKQCLRNINHALIEGRQFLKDARFLIITLGTSIVYKRQGKVVANCHKLPAHEFSKTMFTAEETERLLTETITKIRAVNENIFIIVTVSPVRYIKDDFTQNTLSKANLIVAVHSLLNKFENCFYFPAYEIMMDDLRDYRFYNLDMIHPATVAIDYIWDKFSNLFFNYETIKMNEQIEEIVAARNHRIKNPQSEASSRFIEGQMKKIQQLQSQYPYIQFEKGIKCFSQ